MEYLKKSFKVYMSPAMVKLSRCHECANNKYYGGLEDLCDKCVNHSNFKQKGEAVEEKIKNVIIEQLGVKASDVTREANFMEDLAADSLDCVELTMALEVEFNIEISDEDAEKLLTVGQVIDYIEAKTIK